MSLTFDLTLQHQFSPVFALDVRLSTSAMTVGITGPSGSGKSSILHAIAGLMQPEVFQAALLGQQLEQLSPADRRVGIVLQSPHLFPHLDVEQNLRFGAHRASGRIDSAQVIDMLELSHLTARRVRHLSGGEQQRVALGRALLSEPDLLLLDEPFSALDPDRRGRITSHLRDLLKHQNMPLLLVSHDDTTLGGLCEETHHILDGSVV